MTSKLKTVSFACNFKATVPISQNIFYNILQNKK